LIATEHWHPLIVHFAIVSYVVCIVFDTLWLIKRNSDFLIVSWYNLIIAGISGILGVVSGILAEEKLTFTELAHEAFTFHENLAFLFILCLLIQLLWRIGLRGKFPKNKIVLYYSVGILGFAAVIATGFFGGQLVFSHGVGVKKEIQIEKKNENKKNELDKNDFQFTKPDTIDIR